MKILCSLVLFLLCAGGAVAQTTVTSGPVTTAMKFEWTMPSNVLTVADAATFEPRLRDGSFIPVTALTNQSCALSGSAVVCTSQITQSNADALNRVGVHNLTMSVFRTDVGDSDASLPFVLKTPAGAPTNLRVIR